jgi:ligand-binding sensor protein
MKNQIRQATRIGIFAMIMLMPAFSFAQEGSIKGTLLDAQEQPIPFANIVLYYSTDSSMFNGTISKVDGAYALTLPLEKAFYVVYSAVGYKRYVSEVFLLDASSTIKEFGAIKLQEDIDVLGEVQVKALRPQVIMEADKMIVSVDGTALAAGASVYEVIEKAPGVYVDQDGNIQLNGKTGVQIMIDGRLSYLSAIDLKNMLAGMSAENLKNIEIITNPSAKYDAQGNSGIINIVLKKNTIKGINGSVNGGASYNGLLGYQGGLSLNHKAGKWNSFMNADFSRRNRIRDADLYRVVVDQEGVPTYFDQTAQQENVRYSPSLRIGTDFDINDMHSIGIMFNVYAQNADDQFNFKSLLSKYGMDTTLFSNNSINSEFLNSRANIHYSIKLDTNGTKLSADFNFIRLNNRGDSEFSNEYFVAESNIAVKSDLLTTDNPSYYDILSGQIDFETKLGAANKLELGVKASAVFSDNDLQFYIEEGGSRQSDEERSNHFLYSENILAAYSSLSGKINPKVTYKVGLRAEQTFSEGESITLGTTNPRDYFNFFPSVFVQQTISDNYQINYNYSRRIDRPDYENLNPFIFYLDPKTWAQGNPYLRPQLTHSVGVTQTFMKQYNLVLNASVTDDVITELPIQNPEDGTTVFQQTNLSQLYNYSATMVLPFQPFKWWGINNNVTVFHQDFKFEYSGVQVSNNQTSYMLRTANTFSVRGGWRIEVNADYRSNLVWGLFRIKPQYGIDLAVKKSFLSDKLSASISMSDVLRTRRFSGNASFGGNINEIDQYFGQQSIGFSLRYSFSKGEQFKSRQRNTNLDELNRAGG